MKRVALFVLVLITAGCCSTGTKEPQSIYKLDHQLTTVNGKQVYTQEVVRVPYNP